ncbi:MAG: nucleic acid-binding protein [Gemmataceae bacterium]|nr:nucleic acid-binding protein [Gemmataceae bacterium]
MVSSVVILDTGPLGLASSPGRTQQGVACGRWLTSLVAADVRVIVPEIADYEVRRELLRAKKTRGIARLDTVISWLEYLPISTEAMRQAALLWAQARQQGKPTADDKALDGDAILAAQALTLDVADFVVATTNVDHLSRFVSAGAWSEITA